MKDIKYTSGSGSINNNNKIASDNINVPAKDEQNVVKPAYLQRRM